MQDGPIPELLRRASVILAQEVGRTPGKFLEGLLPELAQRLSVTGAPQAPTQMMAPLNGKAAQPGLSCPITGAVLPGADGLPGAGLPGAGLPGAGLHGAGGGALQKQAHELLAALLSLWNPGGGKAAVPGAGTMPGELPIPFYPGSKGAQRCPFSGAELPTFPGARDQIRRKAHELIETLLITFNEATGEKGLPAESQVPLVTIAAPVAPGDTARATLTVANEESAPMDVSLYSTNFVADHGHELPSLRVTILPRATVIPAQGQVTFEVSIAVPQQTLKGSYCGLIQAQGSRYFKAVLALDVL